MGQLEMFLHGNFLPEDANQMSKIILKNFAFKTNVTSFAEDLSRAGHMGVHRKRLVEIPDGFTEVVTQHPNPNEKNNVVYTMLQLDEGTDEDMLYGTLVGHILKQQIYNNLRTKQQLGYIVWSRDSVNQVTSDNVNQLWWLVMSNHKTTEELQSRMMGLIPHLYKFIKKVSCDDCDEDEGDKQFMRYKRSLMRHYAKNYTSLYRQNRHMWDQINTGNFDFDKNVRLSSLLSSDEITGEGLRRFFKRFMNARSISVQLQGHAKKGDPIEASYSTSPHLYPRGMDYEIEYHNDHRVRVLTGLDSEKWTKTTTVPIEKLNQKFTEDLFLFELPKLTSPPACSNH